MTCAADTYLDSESSLCITCEDGYSSEADSTSCFKCADTNCAKCTSVDSGKCTKCLSGYGWDGTNCVECADNFCAECSDANKGSCTACEANYYMPNADGDCFWCTDGKYSTVGSTSHTQCFGKFLFPHHILIS